MKTTCNAPALIPADHSAAALGDLAAPCNRPAGHEGDHGNGLAVWENPKLMTLTVYRVSEDGKRTTPITRTIKASEPLSPIYTSTWPPCRCGQCIGRLAKIEDEMLATVRDNR